MPSPADEPMEYSGAHPRRSEVHELASARDDASLVEALRRDEAWARATVFRRYARDAERVLARILGHDSELQDLVQDVFVRALEGIGRLQHPDKLRSWLVAVAVYTARERIRSRRRRSWMVLSPREVVEAAPAQAEPEDELASATYRVLERMPADERVALALRMIDGMELARVASACGVSLATIKRRLLKAEARFRALAAGEPSLAAWADGGEP